MSSGNSAKKRKARTVLRIRASKYALKYADHVLPLFPKSPAALMRGYRDGYINGWSACQKAVRTLTGRRNIKP